MQKSGPTKNLLYTSPDELTHSLKEIDEFIKAIDNAQDARAVYNALKYEIDQLGYDKFSYQVIEAPTGKPKKFYLSTYPAEWVKRYAEQKYVSDDIRGRHAARTLRPFQWHEAGRLTDLTPAQQKPILEGAEIGIREGAIVPIHGPGPIRALLAVTSDLPPEQFLKHFEHTRHVLHLIAAYTHERLVQLGFHDALPRSLKLSPREIEVLTWAARGETVESTACKLALSAETVKTHIANACAKLGTSNKTHATATALLYGLIIP